MSVWCIVFTVKALTPSPTLSHSLSRLTYVPSLLWHRHFTHSRLALLRLQFDPYGGSDHIPCLPLLFTYSMILVEPANYKTCSY
ncbi:hypothetical protein T02_6811 [Trichinella nativa]|uniref:Uncharacterized protein n=1 Tax=Trichinella nativa TaxID=6335 RepID=A0A0V1L734_9BILA|nr:hypothetical protein T02_6811 [Trichinella nativa]